jgi:hypothetical protein
MLIDTRLGLDPGAASIRGCGSQSSGAGIAGPTLAYWLRKSNHDLLLLEESPRLRTTRPNPEQQRARVLLYRNHPCSQNAERTA